MVDPRYSPLGRLLIQEGRAQTWLAMQLSARLGRPVYKQEVSRWSLGQVMPEPRTREAIAEVLGAAVDDLFPAHSRDLPTHPSSADNPHRHEEAA